MCEKKFSSQLIILFFAIYSHERQLRLLWTFFGARLLPFEMYYAKTLKAESGFHQGFTIAPFGAKKKGKSVNN